MVLSKVNVSLYVWTGGRWAYNPFSMYPDPKSSNYNIARRNSCSSCQSCLLLSPLNSCHNWLLVCKKEKNPFTFARKRVPSVSITDLSVSVGRGCSRKVQHRLISEAEVKNFLDVVIAVSRTQYRDRGCGCRLLKVLHMPGSSDKLQDVTDQRRVLTDFLCVNYNKTGGTASVNALLVLKLAQRDISVLMLQVS